MHTKIAATFVALAAIAFPGFAFASCKQGFCVSGRDINGYHVVEFSSTFRNVDHYNLSSTNSGQRELGSNERQFSFPVASNFTAQYSLQACMNGGFLQKSICTPWVSFTHTFK